MILKDVYEALQLLNELKRGQNKADNLLKKIEQNSKRVSPFLTKGMIAPLQKDRDE